MILFHNLSYDLQGDYECLVRNIAGNSSAEVSAIFSLRNDRNAELMLSYLQCY